MRPYWSGQLQISLVSFGVSLFTATDSKSDIRFHQISRKTGERIRHQKVSAEEGPVENSDIIKGYEYAKGQYVTIEPEELEHLRLPTRKAIEVSQFVDAKEINPEFFEKPYFVAPSDDIQAEAFAVVRKALQETGKVALGKISFSGREHIVAVAPSPDDNLPGMMAYTLRYADELRKPAEFFGNIKKVEVEEDQLALAQELIKRKAAKFDPSKFKDQYEVALRELVEAKVRNAPIPQEEPAPAQAKVINLMDALRKSIADGQKPAVKKPSQSAASEKGIALVKPAKQGRRRKSA
ncbi:MAG TPA: Ku protein [Silvibacterium sp.]|jgi:DNA end-binding protein Ku|nr:Ku protein [Silvibacterium sp.]